MNILGLILIAILTLVPLSSFAAPKTLTETQLTEMDATEETNLKEETSEITSTKKNPDSAETEVRPNAYIDRADMIRIEEQRLEALPKEQRVNDQIKEINQGLHNPPGN